MHPLQSSRSNTRQTVAADAAPKRLSGGRLIAARVVWLALAIPSLGLFAASLPVYLATVQRPCTDPVSCNLAGSLTAQGLRDLSSLGISVTTYATLLTIFFAIIVAIWSGIGFVIFWRRSDDWFALLTALFLVMFNTTYPGFPVSALALAVPTLNLPITILGAIGLASLALFLVLFPNGRLVPRWMGIFLVLALIGTTSTVLPPNSPFSSNNLPAWVDEVLNVPVFGAIIFSQIYRYARVSSSVERQQTKWVVFGIIIALSGITVLPFMANIFMPALFNQSNTPISTLSGLVLYPLFLLSLPVTVGIAILRARLYDIDVLINRTLVYGSLTIALALVYAGLIIGLEALVRVITGRSGQSPIVIVASTLAIAALFQPLRERLQRVIDRRFYRHKYDAAKTVSAFSATLRNEVDLGQLNEQLITVVQETMHPAHVSLWLRSPDDLNKPGRA